MDHPPAAALNTPIPGPRRLADAWHRIVARLSTGCPLCGGAARGARLCRGCADDLRLAWQAATPRRCLRCAMPAMDTAERACGCPLHHAAFVRTVAAFDYRPPADLLILDLKNRLRLSRVRALAALMSQAACEAGLCQDASRVLVPVPASRASLRRRGFNPAAELARAVSAELGWSCRGEWLARVRDGRKQSRLGREARRLAVLGAYACPVRIDGARVVLVDDVMTTGSTADSAARALARAGAAEVVVLVAARAWSEMPVDGADAAASVIPPAGAPAHRTPARRPTPDDR